MERFDIRGSDWRMQPRTDGLGAFCWAEVALGVKQSYRASRIWNVVLALACAILSAYLVYHKHDPVPVQKVSEEEYQAVLQLERQAQAEKATLRKQLADEHARRLLGDKMIKESNANNAKLVQQLKDLQVSVPAQPIILKEIYKEAATPQGFRQAVARSFGNDIAAHIQIKGE